MAVISLDSPAQAAEAIPFLLGYLPNDHLVLLMADHGRVEFTAAVRLDALIESPTLALDQIVTLAADRLGEGPRDRVTMAFLFAAPDDPRRTQLENWLELLKMISVLRVEHILVVHDEQAVCSCGCSKAPMDLQAGVVAAEATAAGATYLASRDEHARVVEAVPGIAAQVERWWIEHETQCTVEAGRAAWSELLAGQPVTVERAALAINGLQNRLLAAEVMCSIINSDDLPEVFPVTSDVVAMTEQLLRSCPDVPRASTLFGLGALVECMAQEAARLEVVVRRGKAVGEHEWVTQALRLNWGCQRPVMRGSYKPII